jgi:metal-sulfur cluster biosynthetic enzyme
VTATAPYPYQGDAALGERIAKALHRVIDPELAIDIVELGLVYGVDAGASGIDVRITMTSAACPVTEHVVAETESELHRELGEEAAVRVEVVWDPPWGPARLSHRARRALGWE